MPRVFSRLDAPPPLPALTIVGSTNVVTLPQPDHEGENQPSSSSSSSSSPSVSSSVMIVIIIIASAIIVSASLYLLLRLISRRFRRSSLPMFSAVDDVVSASRDNRDLSRDRCLYERETLSDELINSLPVFTFGAVAGNVTGGDCAVCLSRFEKNDQLRLLPLCCHAFHAQCIDAWLTSNQTCPLCRSTVRPTEGDVLDKILSISAAEGHGNSFRIEIGNVSRRQEGSESGNGRRSYSIGSFDYIVDDDGYEVSVESTHRRGPSDCTSIDKDSTGLPASLPSSIPEPPGENLAAQVAGRSWLRDYVDRIASVSSRTISFHSSGRFFSGSSRRSDAVIAVEDLEANRIGEEISEWFRWFSGV